jgi:hydrogenase maturation protein HypF
LLDSISILLGASRTRTYEGEPAIKLEALAEKSYGKKDIPNITLDTKVKSGGIIEILTSQLYADILELIQGNVIRSSIALSAELAIARKFAQIASDIAIKHGIAKIGLSGGVCYNRVIFTEFYNYISKINGKKCIISHKHVPCGDGGVAIGQVPLIQAQLM